MIITRKDVFKIEQQGIGYNRARVHVWVQDYGAVAFAWLIQNGYVRESDVRFRGEDPDEQYYEFTRRGVWLHRWHENTVFDFLYYYVFHLYEIRLWWQRLTIRFGKRYAWQDYLNVEPKDI